MVFIFVVIRAISTRRLVNQVCAIVLEGLIAVPCGGSGLQIAFVIVGVGLCRFLHQGDVIKMAHVDIVVIGRNDRNGGDCLVPLLRHHGSGGILPVGVVAVKGDIVVVCRCAVCIVHLGNEAKKPLALAVVPLHVRSRSTVGRRVGLSPAGQDVGAVGSLIDGNNLGRPALVRNGPLDGHAIAFPCTFCFGLNFTGALGPVGGI